MSTQANDENIQANEDSVPTPPPARTATPMPDDGDVLLPAASSSSLGAASSGDDEEASTPTEDEMNLYRIIASTAPVKLVACDDEAGGYTVGIWNVKEGKIRGVFAAVIEELEGEREARAYERAKMEADAYEPEEEVRKVVVGNTRFKKEESLPELDSRAWMKELCGEGERLLMAKRMGPMRTLTCAVSKDDTTTLDAIDAFARCGFSAELDCASSAASDATVGFSGNNRLVGEDMVKKAWRTAKVAIVFQLNFTECVTVDMVDEDQSMMLKFMALLAAATDTFKPYRGDSKDEGVTYSLALHPKFHKCGTFAVVTNWATAYLLLVAHNDDVLDSLPVKLKKQPVAVVKKSGRSHATLMPPMIDEHRVVFMSAVARSLVAQGFFGKEKNPNDEFWMFRAFPAEEGHWKPTMTPLYDIVCNVKEGRDVEKDDRILVSRVVPVIGHEDHLDSIYTHMDHVSERSYVQTWDAKSPVVSVHASAESGTWLAVCKDGSYHYCVGKNGASSTDPDAEKHEPMSAEGNAVAFAPEGNVVLAYSKDACFVAEEKTHKKKKPSLKMRMAHRTGKRSEDIYPEAVAVSDNFYVVSFKPGFKEHRKGWIYVYDRDEDKPSDIVANEPVRIVKVHEGASVVAIASVDYGRTFVSCCKLGKVYIWDAAAPADDKQIVLPKLRDAEDRVCTFATRPMSAVEHASGHNWVGHKITYCFMACTIAGEILILDDDWMLTKHEQKFLRHEYVAKRSPCLAWHPDAEIFAFVHSDSREPCRLVDINSMDAVATMDREITQIRWTGVASMVMCVDVSDSPTVMRQKDVNSRVYSMSVPECVKKLAKELCCLKGVPPQVTDLVDMWDQLTYKHLLDKLDAGYGIDPIRDFDEFKERVNIDFGSLANNPDPDVFERLLGVANGYDYDAYLNIIEDVAEKLEDDKKTLERYDFEGRDVPDELEDFYLLSDRLRYALKMFRLYHPRFTLSRGPRVSLLGVPMPLPADYDGVLLGRVSLNGLPITVGVDIAKTSDLFVVNLKRVIPTQWQHVKAQLDRVKKMRGLSHFLSRMALGKDVDLSILDDYATMKEGKAQMEVEVGGKKRARDEDETSDVEVVDEPSPKQFSSVDDLHTHVLKAADAASKKTRVEAKSKAA